MTFCQTWSYPGTLKTLQSSTRTKTKKSNPEKGKFREISMVGHNPIEVAKTVLDVADVAWTAVECCQHLHHRDPHENHEGDGDSRDTTSLSEEEEFEALRAENQRLRNLLEQNLKLLQNLSESPCLLQDCPSDVRILRLNLFYESNLRVIFVELANMPQTRSKPYGLAGFQLHDRLLATVDSTSFLNQLKSLHEKSADGTGCEFLFKEASGADKQSAEILINVDLEEPSWWVWVTDEMVPSNVEEWSGIDNENYVLISEEHVVDGVANFMARCMLSNPKAQSMTPEALQKSKCVVLCSEHYDIALECQHFVSDKTFHGITLTKALGGMNKFEKMLHVWHAGKMFCALSTWGLALAGLYKTRAVLRLAAMGVHTSSKFVLKAL
ncbi:unnamed protein product [Ilex paraguariensis]|uniref:Uncharacterized protein n=1 Tax=Ilex paraguariensis TaxID=185542 RepID=A0ABC8UU29_9AQUA